VTKRDGRDDIDSAGVEEERRRRKPKSTQRRLDFAELKVHQVRHED
jgi:hypothetical protein